MVNMTLDRSFWIDKKVFVTGNTGFKGSWLSLWLSELGAEVLGYSVDIPTTPSIFEKSGLVNSMTTVYGDIRDLEKLSKTINDFSPDIVFHLAAQPLVSESYINPVETYETNVMGTVKCLESIRACSSVKSVVIVTTDKCYKNNEWIWGYRECDELGGYDPYSNSKACSELVVESYINSFFNPSAYEVHGKAIATARAGNVVGGGDWAKNRLIPDIIRAIEAEDIIQIRNPESTRPWQHVIEPLYGYLLLAEKLYREGTAYNGGWNFGPNRDSIVPVNKVLSIADQYFHNQLKVNYGNVQAFHEANLLALDNTKAELGIGWKPKWGIEETICKIGVWYKALWNNEDIRQICISQILEYEGV